MIQSKRDTRQSSKKLHRDQYFTPTRIAKYVVEKTIEVIGLQNISEFIEPSAGAGVFLPFLDNCLSYDIEPQDDRITKADYLSLDIMYKAGRCVIGNPPYGSRLNLARRFANKSFLIADYVSFILPISQYQNTSIIYKFDLIYSENLGIINFSGVDVSCCLNIYERPKNGQLNLFKRASSDYIDIHAIRSRKLTMSQMVAAQDFGADFGINTWGGGLGDQLTIGKLATISEYAKIYLIKIKKGDKDFIRSSILSARWDELYPMTATPNLTLWQVYKFVNDLHR